MTAIYRIFNFVWSLRIWYSENVFLIQLPKIDIHTSTRSLTKHKVQSKETEHSSCVSPSCTSCVISYVLYVNVKYNTRDPRAFVRNRINLIMQAFCCSCIVPRSLVPRIRYIWTYSCAQDSAKNRSVSVYECVQ